jgi:hypothetical protein
LSFSAVRSSFSMLRRQWNALNIKTSTFKSLSKLRLQSFFILVNLSHHQHSLIQVCHTTSGFAQVAKGRKTSSPFSSKVVHSGMSSLESKPYITPIWKNCSHRHLLPLGFHEAPCRFGFDPFCVRVRNCLECGNTRFRRSSPVFIAFWISS